MIQNLHLNAVFDARNAEADSFWQKLQSERAEVLAVLAEHLINGHLDAFAKHCATPFRFVGKPDPANNSPAPGYSATICFEHYILAELFKICGKEDSTFGSLFSNKFYVECRSAWSTYLRDLMFVELGRRFAEVCATPDNTLLRFELTKATADRLCLYLWIDAPKIECLLPPTLFSDIPLCNERTITNKVEPTSGSELAPPNEEQVSPPAETKATLPNEPSAGSWFPSLWSKS
jgi:hypothetical protein